jgi:DNA mismatch repair protein MutS2
MDEKSLTILEYPKILNRLVGYCAFVASAEKARNLRPTNDIHEARYLQELTREAVELLTVRPEIDIGGTRDIRQSVDLAEHSGVLDPSDLLDVKYTLTAARNLARVMERISVEFPKLADLGTQIPQPPGIIDAVTRAISDRGDILDSASDRLANIRRDLRIVHDRLLSKLQKMVTDPSISPYLQEALVTQRDGRYVLPLRSEFKGRIKSLIHDQSASGATLFVEPVTVVEQNNQYRELQLSERDEERRILVELSLLVGKYAQEINQVVEVVAEIDLVLAKGKFALDLIATEPRLIPIPDRRKSFTEEKIKVENDPKANNSTPGTNIHLYQARHPLLDPALVVPIDVELDSNTFILVLTGPNTGGKTVTLKTVGLIALMAQSGLHIPVDSGSEISVFEEIFADIGDEQSIEQSLSTFSSHINNIIGILKSANEKSLVLLDELGAGTDPQEGAALARSILSHLASRSITTLVTTHHPELKAYAHSTPGIQNASVEFDLDTLKPTFHLTIGLPGRSNALAIAERLGLPNPIIENARKEITPDELRVENLLAEIHRQRDAARQARVAAELARRNAEDLRKELLERLDQIEGERQELLEKAQVEAQEKLKILESEIDEVKRALIKARQPVEPLRSVVDEFQELVRAEEKPLEKLEPAIGPELQKLEADRRRSMRLGDTVRLRTLGTRGVLSALNEDEAEVQVGVLRVRTRLSDLEIATDIDTFAESAPTPKTRIAIDEAQPNSINLQPSPGIELDLRGKRADEALDQLERYLDAAYIAGLPFVRVIHGKGTGKLRDVVRRALGVNPHVKSYEAGKEQEGGEGVTVAKLAIS